MVLYPTEDLPSVYKVSDLPVIVADLKPFYRAEINGLVNPNFNSEAYKQSIEQKYGMSIYTLEKIVGTLRKRAKSPKRLSYIEQIGLSEGFTEEVLVDWYQKMKPSGSGPLGMMRMVCALIEEVATLKNIPLKKHSDEY